MEEMASHITLAVQQPQASTTDKYHPCEDLLDGGRRREYLDTAVPLYKASIEGDLEAAKAILDKDPNLVRYAITEKKDTPLHVAAAAHDGVELVTYLVDKMSQDELALKNGDGNTAFCIAAISGNVDMVEIMLKENQALATICGSENMTPLYLAALHGHRDMVTFLYESVSLGDDVSTNDDVMDGVLLKCIQADLFDVALRILKDNVKLPQDKQQHVWDVLQVLARKPKAFSKDRRISLTPYSWVINRRASKGNTDDAMELLEFLLERIMERPKDVIEKILRGPVVKEYETETYPCQILFIAAKMNNKFFLVELIRKYPDLIWKRNDDGQTIFHVAVANRHQEVYSILCEIGSSNMDLIAPITDKEGNNILHLVGKKSEENAYGDRENPPFQMFNEFLWYQAVEDILPPPYREVENAAGETPGKLFKQNHKKVVSEGMKLLNESINISMVVAALACTIAFSIVFQIPGGFNQRTGSPVFLHNISYVLFVAMDAFSFLFAASSVICFLSVILSRHQGNMELLYKLWMYGQLALLESVLLAIGAFLMSFYVIYGESEWTIIIYVIAYAVLATFVSEGVHINRDTLSARPTARDRFRRKTYTLFRKKKKF